MKNYSPRLEGSIIFREAGLEIYFKEIKKYPLLSAEEERELARKIQKGDRRARERFIRCNLRLVISIAKNYIDRGLSFSDLIEEGNLGLLMAVGRFDPNVKARFATYATWWIKHTIRKALTESVKTIRIPSYMVDLITKWKDVARRLTDKSGRRPTSEEVAKELDLSNDKMSLVEATLKAARYSRRAEGIEGMWTLSEIIEDKDSKSPVKEASDSSAIEMIKKLLNNIDEREAEVLRYRYGLGNLRPITLREIGKKLRLSKERVRQIETKALRKLHYIMTCSSKEFFVE